MELGQRAGRTDVNQQSRVVRPTVTDIPLLTSEIVRLELFGGRCRHCGRRFKAKPPEDMPTGTPFRPNVHALLLYLHHGHHVGFERLSRFLVEMLGVVIRKAPLRTLLGANAEMGHRFPVTQKAMVKPVLELPPSNRTHGGW